MTLVKDFYCLTQMMLKYLRIAVTALSLTACVLLAALWVRSYYVVDKLIWSNTAQTAGFGVILNRGGFVFGRFELAADTQLMLLNQQLMELVMSDGRMAARGRSRQRAALQNQIAIIQRQIAQYRGQLVTQMMSQRRAVPHLLLLLIAATFTATPWIKWRFGLRTLLVATTLVAVALAAIVVASR